MQIITLVDEEERYACFEKYNIIVKEFDYQ